MVASRKSSRTVRRLSTKGNPTKKAVQAKQQSNRSAVGAAATVSWNIGDKVWALDKGSKGSGPIWLLARIQRVNRDKHAVLVHFVGFSRRYDFWAPFESDRVKPLGSEVPNILPSVIETERIIPAKAVKLSPDQNSTSKSNSKGLQVRRQLQLSPPSSSKSGHSAPEIGQTRSGRRKKSPSRFDPGVSPQLWSSSTAGDDETSWIKTITVPRSTGKAAEDNASWMKRAPASRRAGKAGDDKATSTKTSSDSRNAGSDCNDKATSKKTALASRSAGKAVVISLETQHLKEQKVLNKAVDWALDNQCGPAVLRSGMVTDELGATRANALRQELDRLYNSKWAQRKRARLRSKRMKSTQANSSHKATEGVSVTAAEFGVAQPVKLHAATDTAPSTSSSSTEPPRPLPGLIPLALPNSSNADRLADALRRAEVAETEAKELRTKLSGISKIVQMLANNIVLQ